jgi:hypothetical protein
VHALAFLKRGDTGDLSPNGNVIRLRTSLPNVRCRTVSEQLHFNPSVAVIAGFALGVGHLQLALIAAVALSDTAGRAPLGSTAGVAQRSSWPSASDFKKHPLSVMNVELSMARLGA